MGMTYVDGVATGPTGRSRQVKLLVDSGAAYTVLPQDVWAELEIKPKRVITLRLADGTDLKRSVGACHIRLEQGDADTPVVLGNPGDLPLLGAVTLEEIGLILDPFTRKLHPMRVLVPSVAESVGWEPADNA